MKSEFCPNLSSQAPFWRMGLLVDHNLGPKNGARNAAKSDSPERSISVGAVINSPGLFFCFYFFSCYMVAIWLLYVCYMFAIQQSSTTVVCFFGVPDSHWIWSLRWPSRKSRKRLMNRPTSQGPGLIYRCHHVWTPVNSHVVIIVCI